MLFLRYNDNLSKIHPVKSCYNILIFSPNTHKSHPLTHPWGWGMGWLLCVKILIYVLDFQFLYRLQFWIMLLQDSTLTWNSHNWLQLINNAEWSPMGVSLHVSRFMGDNHANRTWPLYCYTIFMYISVSALVACTNCLCMDSDCRIIPNIRLIFNNINEHNSNRCCGPKSAKASATTTVNIAIIEINL